MNDPRALFALFSALGGGLALAAQPMVDSTRAQRQLDTTLLVRPDGRTVSLGAMGFDEMLASLLWIRTTLTFGERYDTDLSSEWKDWLDGMLETTLLLDPHWSTVYQYGGAMLRVVGEIEQSNRVFEKCAAHRPDLAWCPFSVGMNHYLYLDDPEAASMWLARAAAVPGAPAWWSAAAGRMKTKTGGVETALHFIHDQLANNPTEAERKFLLLQKGRLEHDRFVEHWQQACRSYFEETGERLSSPSQLSLFGISLPPNPRGDEWVVGGDGVVRSAGAEKDRQAKVRGAELRLVAPLKP